MQLSSAADKAKAMVLKPQPMTAAAFEAWAQLPQNADRKLEFIGGEVIEGVSNRFSSKLAMLIGHYLLEFILPRELGDITGSDGGFNIMGDLYIPDVAFNAKEILTQPAAEAYGQVPPDLVVEVISPTDRASDMRRKVVNYLNAGVTVWVIDPTEQAAEVYIPGEAAQHIQRDGTLKGNGPLAGFELPLSKLFPESIEETSG